MPTFPLLIIFCLILGFDSTAQEAQVKVLSWNTFFLPSWVKRTGQMERAASMAEVLIHEDYDVILFQEAFHRKAVQKIHTILQTKYPYQAGPANDAGGFLRLHSGLWVLSRYPLAWVDDITFSSASGNDKLARKGAMLLKIEAPLPLFLVNTHMQAGLGTKKDENRRQQLEQIRAMTDKHTAGYPVLFAGDFNIEKSDTANYHRMLRILDANDGITKGAAMVTYNSPANDMVKGQYVQQLDYILAKGFSEAWNFRRNIRVFQQNWSPKRKDLSDHYAIEIECYKP